MSELNEDSKDLVEQIKAKEIIGKHLGEIREWRSFSSDHELFSPFGSQCVKMTREQLIETFYHCMGVIQILQNDILKMNEKQQC